MKKPHNYTIDILRVLSIFAVVLIHTTSKTLEVGHFDVIALWFSLLLNQSVRFAVPLLFFISGFVLQLNYPTINNVQTFYKKRFRLVIPYVAWSVFYFLFIYKIEGAGLFSWTFLKILLLGDASYQLYFIPAVILLYLLFPFLQRYVHKKFSLVFWLMLFAVQLVVLDFEYYFLEIPLYLPIKVAVFNVGLFFVGMVASSYEERIVPYVKKRLWIFIGMALLMLAALYYETRMFYLMFENIHWVYTQWRPTVFLYSLLTIPLLYCFFEKGRPLSGGDLARSSVRFFSKISFFIFFIHPIFIHVFWRFIGSYLFSKSAGHVGETFWFDPLAFIFVLSASIFTASVVRYIPKLNIITGVN